MKKFTAFALLIFCAAIIIYAQPGKQGKGDQDKKPQKENRIKKERGKAGKEHPLGKHKADVKKNQPNSNVKAGQGRANENRKINLDKGNFPHFTRENFKERRSFFKGEKVTICHNSSDGNPVTIRVSANALQAHLDHGDSRGNCEYRPGIFSDVIWRKREDLFDRRERTRDQVIYSQGVLQYALQRLAEERNELLLLRDQNVPLEVISRQENQVALLDNNVSLLQTLISTALSLLAD